jgi:hypothetical protein
MCRIVNYINDLVSNIYFHTSKTMGFRISLRPNCKAFPSSATLNGDTSNNVHIKLYV